MSRAGEGVVDVDALQWSLEWAGDQGGLRGKLTVRNDGQLQVTLGMKPALTPVGIDRARLAAETLWTLEYSGPPVELPPGSTAIAFVAWAGWDGPPASPDFIVKWDGGETCVIAAGPHQPAASGPATNLTAGGYRLV